MYAGCAVTIIRIVLSDQSLKHILEGERKMDTTENAIDAAGLPRDICPGIVTHLVEQQSKS